MLSLSCFIERSFLLFKAKLASGFQKPRFSSPAKWCSWVSVTCHVLWEDKDTWSLSLLWGLATPASIWKSGYVFSKLLYRRLSFSKGFPLASLVKGFKIVHLQGILKSWLLAHRSPSGIHWASQISSQTSSAYLSSCGYHQNIDTGENLKGPAGWWGSGNIPRADVSPEFSQGLEVTDFTWLSQYTALTSDVLSCHCTPQGWSSLHRLECDEILASDTKTVSHLWNCLGKWKLWKSWEEH